MVQYQRVSSQELVDREKIIVNHLLRLQDKEEETRKEIEELKKDQDRLTMEKAQLWNARVFIKRVVSVSCQKVLEITVDMDAKERENHLE